MSNNVTLTQLRAGKLKGLVRLNLSCQLTEFPKEIFTLADSLEILDLSGNALSTLPVDLYRLKKLKILFCSNNQFTHFPELLGQCEALSMIGFKANQISMIHPKAFPPHLRWLILTDNQLTEIPSSIGACSALQKLMLAGNRLNKLPDSLQLCQQLELLRISANQFSEIPDWLLSMPRLAWLAMGGNPMNLQQEQAIIQQNNRPTFHWHQVTLHEKLGEGASGIIYRSSWQHAANDSTHIAVKLFKGSMTSDGLPQSEMATWMASGSHPNISHLIGQLIGHSQHGLVMPLMREQLKVLAEPPSFASCTRDIYAKDVQFSLHQVLTIADTIAQAMQHLHTCGILHGDVYAHNILYDGLHECVLSDFGGASMLPKHLLSISIKLQQLEVRAFACLLEELLNYCTDKAEENLHIASLRRLQNACQETKVESRPLFQEITFTIQQLLALN